MELGIFFKVSAIFSLVLIWSRSYFSRMEVLKVSFLIIHRPLKFMRKGLKIVTKIFSSSGSIFVIERSSDLAKPFWVLMRRLISYLNCSSFEKSSLLQNSRTNPNIYSTFFKFLI